MNVPASESSHIPATARLVIIGAGIVGCSTAYHLARMGWKDIVVIDQGPLYETGGSTSHAPGIVFGTNPSHTMNRMAQYTTEVYRGLRFDGQQCWYPVGSIEVATTDDRMQEIWRRHGYNLSYGQDAHILSPTEIQQHVPLIDPAVLKGGMYLPNDGNARPWQAAGALATQATDTGGVTFHGKTLATDIQLEHGRVTAIVTDQGRIKCEQVLLCTNIWGSVLADKIGVTLPIMACAHQYAITEPLPELAGQTQWLAQPPIRHQDRAMYFRQWGDAYCAGSYRHEPRLVNPHDVGKDAFHIWRDDDFASAIEDTNHLYPTLRGREYVTKVNGMFVFSVDGFPIMGPTHVPGCWTAIGIWVTHAGGAGKVMAEWMTEDASEWDTREMNVARFCDFQKTHRYIRSRAAQNYREVYDIIHPLAQIADPRNVRLAPYHLRLQEQQGHFFASSGWETAQWYDANAHLVEKYDDRIPHRSGWEARHWSRIEGGEHLALREHGGLFNICPFSKIEIVGKTAAAFLESMCANRVDVPVGRIVYTALCDHKGGIRADVTVTRRDVDRFWILTGAATGPAELRWLRDHAPDDGSVQIRDVTSTYAGLALWGPRARRVLQSVTEENLSNDAFACFTAQHLTIDTIPVYALRVSYAGELGWELYCRAEYGLYLWDTIWEAGRPHHLIALGGGAFNSLRMEKGYRAYGSDLHTEYTPFDVGLGWAVCLDQGDFLGREALVEIAKNPARRKLCCLTSDDPNAMALGKEPIFDGKQVISYVTSADYGYSIGKLIMYAYLPQSYSAPGTQLELQYFERRYQVTVDQDVLFDARMTRFKS